MEITARYKFGGGQPVSEGIHIFQVKDATFTKDDPNKPDKGWTYKIEAVCVDGGDSDGLNQWEFFSTGPGPKRKYFGCFKMMGFLVKAGVLKADAKMDSSKFETEDFAKNFIAKVKGKKYGADIEHQERTDNDGNKRVNANSVEFLTVEEAKAKRGNGKAVAAEEDKTPQPTNLPDVATLPPAQQSDDWQ